MHLNDATAHTLKQVTSIDGHDTESAWEFDLQNCQITSIDKFHPNDNLGELILDENPIESIDNFDVNKLESFCLGGAKIKSIDNFDVKNLEHFRLSYNPIQSIDNFNVKNLESLDLIGTQIETIDNFDVKNLTRLQFTLSSVKGIYHFDAKNLEELFLNKTKIEYINDFYFNPETISLCDLSDDNPIKYVKPETLLRLRNRFPQYLCKHNFDSEGFVVGLSEQEKEEIREKVKKHGEEYERNKKIKRHQLMN